MTTTVENPLQIIDVSEISKTNAYKMLKAAHTQGFLLLEGHGFSQDQVDAIYRISDEFFSMPVQDKNQYQIDPTNCGYSGVGTQNLQQYGDDKDTAVDLKEGFDFSQLDPLTYVPSQPLPSVFTENMDALSSTIHHFIDVSQRVFKLLGMGLDIDDSDGGSDWLSSRHIPKGQSGSTFRLLRYPSPVEPGASEEQKDKFKHINVAGAHTDFGSITMLFQRKDEDGLEILSPISKKWESVPYVPASPKYASKGEAPPLVINIADQLSFWTNGYLKSTIHRVRFPPKLLDSAQDRYSVVMFIHPEDTIELEPVPAKVVQEIKGRGATKYMTDNGCAQTAGAYLKQRLQVSYKWKD